MFHRMFMQFSGVVIGRLVAAAAQALTVVLLARWSPPEVFGLVLAVQAVLGALTVALGFGFPQYAGVLRAREPESPAIAGIFQLNRTWSWTASALCMTVFAVLGIFHPIFLMILPLALSLGLGLKGAIWDSISVADGQVRLFSTNLVLRRVVTLVCFVLLHAAQAGVVSSYCIAVFLAQLLYNARIRRKSAYAPVNVAQTKMRPILERSKHFWVDSMSGMLRQLDVATAGLVLGPLAAGYLAVPSRIASPLMLLPSSFATLILPRVSAGRGRTARQGLYMAGGVTVVIATVLALSFPFLDELVVLTLGESYLPAVPVTRTYFAGFVALSLVYMLGAVLQGLGLSAAVGRNSGLFSVLSLAMLALGGHFYGLQAAAWGYVWGIVGQVAGLLYLLVFHFRGTGEHIRRRSDGDADETRGHSAGTTSARTLRDEGVPR